MADEEYELLPHKEIEELKEELAKLKEFEITPTKKLRVSLVELNSKLDKLLDIFEDAMRQVQIEEGGMTFHEKMKPIVDKMNKILDQNAQIAEGIVTIADMMKGQKGVSEKEFPDLPKRNLPEMPAGIPKPPSLGDRPNIPPPPRTPMMPPPPKKKRTFGIL
ncbi:hypothetical protein KY304_02445 [Candidatus Woesearchaeota archaeon]|nr:hypothetical protein [Candidatus Woesearchaeota archaeon]MBW2978947.1 hypothetical protein [Candidatus Woesearchaeota archaeon]